MSKYNFRRKRMNTIDFKTKTLYMERKNPSIKNFWTVALDIGYSGVKGFSPNSVYCFPSYAKKSNGSRISIAETRDDEILYKDENGDVWTVGSCAQDMNSSDNTNDSVAELYGRRRYNSPMFRVLIRVGIALGMLKNECGDPNGKIIRIQTGLPTAYINDAEDLKDVFCGVHDFSIKKGKSDKWTHIRIDFEKDMIKVMPQPMGAFFSISTDKDGNRLPEAAAFSSSVMLIFDPGFGTFDVFNINNGSIVSSENGSYDNLGMKRVMEETVKGIKKKYNVEVTVPNMQKILATGQVRKFEKDPNTNRRTNKFKPIGEILEAASQKICAEALNQVDTDYNMLIDHDYLVVAGGTGDAWYDYIKDYYGGMDNLTIIPGNQNDTSLPFIFSNVRGYYMFMLGDLRHSASSEN